MSVRRRPLDLFHEFFGQPQWISCHAHEQIILAHGDISSPLPTGTRAGCGWALRPFRLTTKGLKAMPDAKKRDYFQLVTNCLLTSLLGLSPHFWRFGPFLLVVPTEFVHLSHLLSGLQATQVTNDQGLASIRIFPRFSVDTSWLYAKIRIVRTGKATVESDGGGTSNLTSNNPSVPCVLCLPFIFT